MKNKNLYMLSFIAIFAIVLLVGCNAEDNSKSAWDPGSFENIPDPVISAILPVDGVFGATGKITIQGNNFSTVKTDNKVYFNAIKNGKFASYEGKIETATSTELVVKVPNFVSDSTTISLVCGKALKIAKWNNNYSIKEGFNAPYVFDKVKKPMYAVSVGTDSAFYTAFDENGTKKLSKFSPLGIKTDFYVYTGAVNGLKVINDNGNQRPLISSTKYLAKYNGTAITPIYTYNNATIYDFDFDANKNIWMYSILNKVENITRVKPDINGAIAKGTTNKWDIDANIRCVRVYDGYLYLAGLDSSDKKEKVIRYAIDANGDININAKEDYFVITGNSELDDNTAIYSITFDITGNLYIGVNKKIPIIVVSPNKSYTGLLTEGVLDITNVYVASIAFGVGDELYVLTLDNGNIKTDNANYATLVKPFIYKVKTGKQSALYYGRQ